MVFGSCIGFNGNYNDTKMAGLAAGLSADWVHVPRNTVYVTLHTQKNRERVGGTGIVVSFAESMFMPLKATLLN